MATHLRARWSVMGVRIDAAFAALAVLCWPAKLSAQDAACWSYIQEYRQMKAQDTSFAAVRARQTAFAAMRRCIDETDSVRAVRSYSLVVAEAQRLGATAWMIPESHDEGRLPDGSGTGELGPMAFIYASPLLGGFTRKAQIEEHGLPGALAAVVDVQLQTGEGPTLPTSYTDLGLHAGKSCLWLYLAPGSTTYQVNVTQVAAGALCSRSGTIVRTLDVAEERFNRFKLHEQYPAVARFDVDALGRPVLAFKCIDAFCEAGTTSPRRAWVHPSAMEESQTVKPPVHRYVKGWHDEQEFAEQYRASDGQIRWRSTNVKASIVPDEKVSSYDSRDFHVVHPNKWFAVAKIHIHSSLPNSNKFYGWGLRQGVNHVGIRYDTARDTLVIGIFASALPNQPSSAPTPRRTWLVQKRELHFDAAVPGTARFRFTVGDDGIWTPCGNACCKADGEVQ